MSDKINIITSGCSFTETPHASILNHINIKEIQNAINDNFNSINYIYFLAEELYRYHNNNFTIYNLGKGSAGNHVIYTLLQTFLNNHNLESIYSTVQLSGILRLKSSMNRFIEISHLQDEWINDFDIEGINSYENIIEKQIKIYQKIRQLFDKPSLKFKMFFGWGVLSNSDIENYQDKFDEIEIDTFLTTSQVQKCTPGLEGQNYEEYFGGMSEFVQEKNLPISIFKSESDAHLNPYANFIFYKEWYRNYFVEWGLLPEKYVYDFDENKLMETSNWQK
jgi:hypothetical protein